MCWRGCTQHLLFCFPWQIIHILLLSIEYWIQIFCFGKIFFSRQAEWWFALSSIEEQCQARWLDERPQHLCLVLYVEVAFAIAFVHANYFNVTVNMSSMEMIAVMSRLRLSTQIYVGSWISKKALHTTNKNVHRFSLKGTGIRGVQNSKKWYGR